MGIILFILLLVLFFPVFYKISGEMHEDFRADVRFNWLFVFAVASYTKDEGLKWNANLFNRFVIMSSDQDDKDEESSSPEDTDSEEGSAIESAGNEEETDIMSLIDEAAESAGDLDESDAADNYGWQEDDFGEPDLPEMIGSDDGKRTARDKIGEIEEKGRDLIDLIKEKYHFIITKKNHIEQFLDRPYTKVTIERIKTALIIILKDIKPRELRGDVTLGLGDAALTGQATGIISAAFPVYKNRLIIRPVYNEQIVDGEAYIKGRMFLGVILLPVVRIILSKEFKQTRALMNKI